MSVRAQKIAVIGNMNNSNFALMRYLRDLGRDAHLFLYSNELSHFGPEEDTTEWEKWKPFVHRLPISNGGRDALYKPLGPTFAMLDGFDLYCGNGISPVLFHRAGKHLDVFIPYGEGVEFIIEHEWTWRHPAASLYTLVRKWAMERAIKTSVGKILTANMHDFSMQTYRRLGLSTINLPVIALYDDPPQSHGSIPPVVTEAIERMRASELAILYHSSHNWKKLPVRHYMGGVGKRTQWLIEGFAEFISARPESMAVLCFLEYGIDVDASKALIAKLGIEDHVIWLPQLHRRVIMELMEEVDLGASAFAGMMWGGVGWEFLSRGVPMLHSLDEPETYAIPERPLPPFMNVHSPQDIRDVLLHHDRASLRGLRKTIADWYQAHQGRALANRYLELFDQVAKERDANAAR